MRIRIELYIEAVVVAMAMATASSCRDNSVSAPVCKKYTEFEIEADRAGSTDTDTVPGTITTLNIRDFRVSAFNSSHADDVIMFNMEVKRNGLNSWTYSPAVEWPDYPIDFEAVTPSTEEIYRLGLWEWGYPSTIEFDSHKEGKTDLCVAVSRHIHQISGKIKLNFRHALARIDIKIAADIPGSTLIVKKIDMFNVPSKSVFLFPRGSTYPHNQTGQFDDCWASWTQSNATDTIAYYISEKAEGTALSSIPNSIGNQDNRFYIPYTFIPMTDSYGYISGSGIRILCKVANAATGEKTWPDKNTPYQLVPPQWNYNWGYIYLPFADTALPAEDSRNKWRPGFSYTYHIQIRRPGTLPPAAGTATRAATVPESPNSITVTAIPY